MREKDTRQRQIAAAQAMGKPVPPPPGTPPPEVPEAEPAATPGG
jgi:hypothetical protein